MNSPRDTKKNRFYNPHFKPKSISAIEVVRSIKAEKNTPPPPKGFVYPNPKEPRKPSQPTACWLNHSSFHVDYQGVHILTDPIFSKRCSPVSLIGPKRKHPIPYALKSFSTVNLVLISHNHYDHLDKKTVLELHQLHPHIQWIVPVGVARWFHKQRIHNVSELGWHSSISLQIRQTAIVVTAVPTQHFSGRGLFDRDKTLWNGYQVTLNEQKKLYFVGDTGYNTHDFKNIGELYGPMDLSLIPIGAYYPRFFMRKIHVNPEEAVLIHQDVRSKLSIGMHWKTFKLTTEHVDQPPYDLYQALKKRRISPTQFRVLEIGQKIHW